VDGPLSLDSYLAAQLGKDLIKLLMQCQFEGFIAGLIVGLICGWTLF